MGTGKVTTSWQAKGQRTPPKARLDMKKYQPSDHPLVNYLRDVEGDPPEHQVIVMENYEATHCTPKFFQGREIAMKRMADGKIRRWFACDVCGYVGYKDGQAR